QLRGLGGQRLRLGLGHAVCLGLDQELADPAEQRFRRLGVHLASLAGASLAPGGVSSPPGPRNGAWGALCGVRPVGCSATLPAVDRGCLTSVPPVSGKLSNTRPKAIRGP